MTTPGQTIGPFFGYALPYVGGSDLVRPGHPGAIRLHGRVLDGDGQPVPDALIEIGQTDPGGALVNEPGSLHRDGWTFTGWGRAATDNAGRYSFTTLLPGGPNPFFAVTVFARGLLDRLATRAYVPGHGLDPLLSRVPEERRHTLIAVAEPDGLRFDVRLQGQDETVFLAYPVK
ncbi:protocatechuate 3,4-dioxygenase subunit alpha [uncultured Jatrophihabitans sp.]|uniref:protocatechuate 3,4-dioxygenase subunit alpha n=1 Tax=uncultured Jatrophihabitans sp. TaxID=1610747 RepID=UPI0035CA075D